MLGPVNKKKCQTRCAPGSVPSPFRSKSANCKQATGELREALDSVTHPQQLDTLAAAANPLLPSGDELAGVLDPAWPAC